jgi:DNA polymerase (family X)
LAGFFIFIQMTNKEVANTFTLLAKLMEIHHENPFKIRSYQNAAFQINQLKRPIMDMDANELSDIKGFGEAIVKKAITLMQTGHLPLLEKYIENTPPGVIEMLRIKGIGGKKIGTIWQELGVESLGELEYACHENRLALLKGFGKKTQQNILDSIGFIKTNQDKFLYADIDSTARDFLSLFISFRCVEQCEFTGTFRRKLPVLVKLEFLIEAEIHDFITTIEGIDYIVKIRQDAGYVIFKTVTGILLQCFFAEHDNFQSKLFESTGSKAHLKLINYHPQANAKSEIEIYKSLNLPFIIPEMREGRYELEWHKKYDNNDIIREDDISGIIHAHSTYSDGSQTIEELVLACIDKGYEYLGISDHSQSAFYANGLNAERIKKQHEEIERLNQKLFPFKIFKGIESDILNDGRLDYTDNILESFDFIIASVHSNLGMNEEKAMARLKAAIENPFTTIMGHLTGRLLLSRNGYPVDHQKIIQLCRENKVAIELNANPHRLDLDWKWIYPAIKESVFISINPDAHNIEGIDDTKYGILVARKGGLVKQKTLNTLSKTEFEAYLKSKKAFNIGFS